jgi:hypothetical protein
VGALLVGLYFPKNGVTGMGDAISGRDVVRATCHSERPLDRATDGFLAVTDLLTNERGGAPPALSVNIGRISSAGVG